MIITLPIIMLLFLWFMNTKILKGNYTLFNPISIVIYVWIIVFISHHLFYDEEPYTFDAYLWITVGLTTLAIGFWLTANARIIVGKKNYDINREYNIAGVGRIVRKTSALEILRLIYYIYHILFVLSGRSIHTFLTNNTYVRYRYLSYNPGMVWNLFEFFANSICMVSYVFLGVLFAKKAKHSKMLVILWTVTEVLIAIITMSRLCLIMYIIAFGISYLYNTDSVREERKTFLKFMPLVVVGVFAFLMLIGMQRNYMASGDLRKIVIDKIFIYFVGPT